MTRPDDDHWMRQAIAIAAQGLGRVEPNPMVGCVVVADDRILATGYHERFGAPHAEIRALDQLTDSEIRAATLYVTLEPCCHFGKTPPCVDRLLNNPPARIVVAQPDPFPEVAGKGILRLRQAGIAVDVGVLHQQARELNAPYLKLLQTGMPWVLGKWAMTLDGSIATSSGDSQWISNQRSRAQVHRIRGRMDAILVGIETVRSDDPMLTARFPSDESPPRVATRVVFDSRARTSLESQLVKSAQDVPVIIALTAAAPLERIAALEAHGCEILKLSAIDPRDRFREVLRHLGSKRCTNVLVEGGSQLLGCAFDAGCVDEAHVFIAPKIIGGSQALRAVGGKGIEWMNHALRLHRIQSETFDGDIYVRGTIMDDETIASNGPSGIVQQT